MNNINKDGNENDILLLIIDKIKHGGKFSISVKNQEYVVKSNIIRYIVLNSNIFIL